jgi:hypothetical protein
LSRNISFCRDRNFPLAEAGSDRAQAYNDESLITMTDPAQLEVIG